MTAERTRAEEAYALLAEEAERVGWPKIYGTDLHTHDRENLQAHENAGRALEFVWVLRQCGTELYMLHDGHAHRWAVSARKTWADGRWYLYRHGQLAPATADECCRLLLDAREAARARAREHFGSLQNAQMIFLPDYGPTMPKRHILQAWRAGSYGAELAFTADGLTWKRRRDQSGPACELLSSLPYDEQAMSDAFVAWGPQD